MEIHKSAGYISMRLTHELKRPEDIWRGFLEDLKDSVPATERSYEPETNAWQFPEKYQQVLMRLKNKWFTDKNQVDIFSEDMF